MNGCFEKQIADDINELKELIESREGVEIENFPINRKESVFDFKNPDGACHQVIKLLN